MGKATRTAPLIGSSRRKRPVILPKPFGFCCAPERPPSEHESLEPTEKRRTPPPASALSLGSVHECPALKLRLQVTSKRPPQIAWTEGPDGKRVPAELGAKDPGGLLDDTTQSSIDLMIEAMRKQRQAEYERQMDIWAELGEQRTLDRIKRLKCEGRPYWYAEYSFDQLRELKQLEDSLFKDKKQKSINRTKQSLEALGAINELKKVEPKVLAKLIRDYSTEPIKFLCEIYKATNGIYPGQENYYCTYDPSMRIIMSGIAFLELPDIVVELHKILPPVIKYPLPPKPAKPTVVYPKKKCAPLLQKLILPPNNRLYKQKIIEWELKCRDMRRPLVILPKKNKLEQLAQQQQGGEAKLVESKAAASITNHAGKKPEPVKKEEEKRLSKVSRASKASRISGYEEEGAEAHVDYEEFEGEDENLSKDGYEEIHNEEGPKRRSESTYQMQQIEWTTPPSPCPYKYRKLMNEQGPLKENEAFFSALRPVQRVRDFPGGRENLTMGLQTYLLDVEADMHPLQAQASQLLEEVGRLAREILESGPKCDGCCSCRQTRRSHLLWHATQGPHNVIEGVSTDGKGQRQVIGSTALHTPASSMSSNSEPPCVPSKDRLVKERVLGGFTVGEDGQPVRHVEAISKLPEHIPRRELRPDSLVEVIRNVPPCGCNERRKQLGEEPQTEIDLTALSKGKDEGVCYGVKFRPKEGPGYECGANDPAEDVACPCAAEHPVDCPLDECVCDDFLPLGDPESYEEEESRQSSIEEEQPLTRRKPSYKVCVPCGKKVYPCRGGSPMESDNRMKATCSCDSLSEFLELDLCKIKCEKPPKESYDKRSEKRDSKSSKSQTSKKEETPADRKKSDAKKPINKGKKEAEKVIEPDNGRRSSRTETSKKNNENNDHSDKNGTISPSETVDKMEKPENSEKPEKSNNVTKPEKSNNVTKPEKSNNVTKSERSHSLTKPEKSNNLTKPEKSKKSEKPEKPEKPTRPPAQPDKTKMPETDEPIPKAPEDTGPPFGDRTKSEQALPAELTIAYLVDRHPPEFTSEQVPVREGGRPCRCRENRNNRKKLIYGIGNTTAGDPSAAVIEGIAWLSPVPSIRRSEEYIPEYEVYDSPYGCKACGAGSPARKAPADAEKIRKQRTGRSIECVLKEDDDEGEEEEEEIAETESTVSTVTEVILDRSKDWNNAMKDDYLTEFYAEKPSRVPCWKRCARDSEPRRLKVMKPVCECRYERKIVKREEERRRWRERKKRLQSLPKEEFLRLSDVAVLPIERAEGEEPPLPRCNCVPPAPTEEPVHVIDGIAVQTPCTTPTRVRSCVFPNLPFKPDLCGAEAQAAKPVESEAPKEESHPKKKKTSASKTKKRRSNSSRVGATEEKAAEHTRTSDEEKVDKVKSEKSASEKTKAERPAPEKTKPQSPASETVIQELVPVPRRRRRTSYLNRMEDELMDTVRNTLAKMDGKKFISVKFPDYNRMPQLAYWVSYRVKGMNFTRKYREMVLLNSTKLWESKKRKSNPILAQSVRITKKSKEKLHFGYVRYWKQKLKKKELAFYMGVRKHIVDLGRDEWFSMEFGKFPNVLFKQAYFTYMPTKERDTVAFRPWFPT